MFEKLKQYFEPVESISAQEAKRMMQEAPEGAFTLLDVRQPGEYARKHIPGAKLIPLPSLYDEADAIDLDKPVFVHCALGGRSRVAAHILAGKGVKRVYDVKGGISAWDGPITDGPVELNMGLVTGKETEADILALAYGMEAALGGFYTRMAGEISDAETAGLLRRLAAIEEKHQETLVEIAVSMPGLEGDREALKSKADLRRMEGGMDVEEFIKANSRYLTSPSGVLDLAMMIEARALDLYLRFADAMDEEKTKGMLFKIGNEEKAHLKALGDLRNDKV
jgi:sulfur-carrier protein adenylyltransferase/sulfurtransferase